MARRNEWWGARAGGWDTGPPAYAAAKAYTRASAASCLLCSIVPSVNSDGGGPKAQRLVQLLRGGGGCRGGGGPASGG